jgi:predicted DNA-binding protein
MKQLLIELDDRTAERLEQVAPSASRRRSAFVRAAIQRALDEVVEQQMAEAYRKSPDDVEPPYLDAAAWSPRKGRRRRRGA